MYKYAALLLYGAGETVQTLFISFGLNEFEFEMVGRFF